MKRLVLVCVLGLVVSGCDALKTTPTDPTPAPNPAAVSYTAIGASDAIGYGSSVACLPFAACPDGKGYVQLVTKQLKTDGKTVSLLNLGLPGSVLGPELQTLGNQLGRGVLSNFLENEIPFVASNATVVTVFAGGNDVNVVGSAVSAGYAGADQAGYIQTKRQGFQRDLREMLSGIRSRSASARVVMLNLPNFAGLPYAAAYSLAEKRVLQQIAVGFSAEVNALRNDGVLVVDVMCDPVFYQAGTYSSDGFHPNDAGYARMADILYPAVATGQASAPKSSCAQMTMF